MATNEELQEQIDELTEQLTTARGSQAGSDRTVTELQARIKELENGAGQDDKPTNEELDERAALLDRRASAMATAKELDIDLDTAYTVLGVDGASDEERLAALATYGENKEKATTEKLLKQNGRNPYAGGGLNMTPPTLEQISNMSDAEQRNLPAELIASAMDKHAKTGQRTYRDTLLGAK